jgi:uncharacterized coiled-coil DUF342 family protein
MAASKRDQLLAKIAELKERRNQTILLFAPEDDAAAGQAHPEVRELEAQIRDLRAEVAALDAEKEG